MRFQGFVEEWEIRKIESLGTFSGGGTPDTSIDKFWSGDIPWISSSDLIEGDIHNIIKSRYITEEAINNSATKITPKGSILMVSRVGVGKFAVADENLCTSQDFTNLITDENEYFICYYFQAKKNLFLGLSQGTSIKGFTTKDIKSVKFCIPKLLEQKKIASFLALIDKRINTQNKIIENQETLMLGVLTKLFNQKLKTYSKKLPIFPLWEYKKGSDIFYNCSNKKHNSDLPILAITQEYGAVPRDLIDHNITVTEKSIDSYKVVDKGDFIISLRSFQGGIEYSNYYGICSPAYIILKNSIDIVPEFYKYYLKSAAYIKLLNKKLEGIRDGKMISYNYFSEINLPYPCLEEQKYVADMLTTMDNKIKIEKQILNSLSKQKEYLSQQMFI